MSRANVNKIILLGNLGHDPELRYSPKGNPVLTLSLATSRDAKTADGEKRQETQWHRATVWGKRAEVCAKYLSKGSRVYVEGELQTKNWIDKDGQSHRSSEILVDDVRFLSAQRKESDIEESAPMAN
jgi:single-strand DNA-binding protein